MSGLQKQEEWDDRQEKREIVPRDREREREAPMAEPAKAAIIA